MPSAVYQYITTIIPTTKTFSEFVLRGRLRVGNSSGMGTTNRLSPPILQLRQDFEDIT